MFPVIYMKKKLLILGVVLCLACKNKTNNSLNNVENKSVKPPSALIEAFRYNPKNNTTLISVHRGGKGILNYPENCLETIQYINDSIDNVIFEIDVAKTKDNILVLMHDNTINRTTIGEGELAKFSFNALQSFFLKDDYGNATTFTIPLFKNVLHWAKERHVILTIDIKKSVALEDVVNAIRVAKAEDVCIIITYNLKQAELANAIAPELMLSVSARNYEEFNWLLHSGIPTENMIAFTGTRLSPDSLYTKIHNYGIKTMLGTLGNLDKRAAAKGDSLYNTWINKGIDVLATDRPFAVSTAIYN